MTKDEIISNMLFDIEKENITITLTTKKAAFLRKLLYLVKKEKSYFMTLIQEITYKGEKIFLLNEKDYNLFDKTLSDMLLQLSFGDITNLRQMRGDIDKMISEIEATDI